MCLSSLRRQQKIQIVWILHFLNVHYLGSQFTLYRFVASSLSTTCSSPKIRLMSLGASPCMPTEWEIPYTDPSLFFFRMMILPGHSLLPPGWILFIENDQLIMATAWYNILIMLRTDLIVKLIYGIIWVIAIVQMLMLQLYLNHYLIHWKSFPVLSIYSINIRWESFFK